MSVAIEWSHALTDEVRRIRRAVFMEEQGISEADEFDGTDGGCVHWLLRDGGRAVATLRTKRQGDVVKIGRVATLRHARGRGHAGELMGRAMDEARTAGAVRAFLSAQVPVIGWYERFGFAAEGAPYDDAGIPHRDMWAAL